MKTVLLAVDIQQLLTNGKLYAFDRFCRNISSLMELSRKNGTEVVYVRHDDGEGKALHPGNAGFEIYQPLAPAGNERVFDKTVNSPFCGTGLLEYLRDREVKRLIVVGLQTDYCIDAAVKCGYEHGFEIIVPEYCNSTVDNSYMTAEQSYSYYNHFIWKDRYAKCVDIDTASDMIRGK